MSQYEVHLFLESRGQPQHDVEIVEGASRADLDSGMLQGFLERVRQRRPSLAGLGDDELLRQLHVLDAQVLSPGLSETGTPSLSRKA